MSDKIQPDGQETRPMAKSQIAATSSGEAALPNSRDLTAGVPNWSIVDYCVCYGRLLNASQFSGMFSDDWGKTMIDCRGLRLDRHRAAWDCRWTSLWQRWTGTINPGGSLDMWFIRHGY